MPLGHELHPIRVDFAVTQDVRRFVYLYAIAARGVHVIDSGVAGAETALADRLRSAGRSLDEVRSILLTHAHPDHIGGASRIKDASHATVFASVADKPWIEDIDLQFAQRPIPNFYGLVNQSVLVDRVVADGAVLPLEDGVTLRVVDASGHSAGSVCFLWVEQGVLFTGDAVPVPGDIPIYTSASASIATLRRLLALDGVTTYMSAWDEPCDAETGKARIRSGLDHLVQIDDAVRAFLAETPDADFDTTYARVCAALSLTHLTDNPLFRTSVAANVREVRAQ